ncbi:MAG: transglutaminase family protein [Leptospira sp.]|nr:transglutaminase family protein [Leptospira sp.]
MSIKISLTHRTTYTYDRDVTLSPHIIRLRPAPHTRIPILSYSLQILPEEHFINWQQDPFGNYQARYVFPKKTRKFEVLVDLTAEMRVFNPFDFFVESSAENFPFTYSDLLRRELTPYLQTEPPTPQLEKYMKTIDRKSRSINDFLVYINQKIANDIGYIIRMEPGIQSPETTLTLGSGSCRDSAYLLIQILRHLGIAARFVSGYLIQLKADTVPIDGPPGPSTDFTDLHAWAEVFLPGAGWVGLDATSGLLAGEGHIPLACTPEPESAAAVTGAVDEAKSEFEFEMKIQRIFESPRVTKPYTENQWNEIIQLGNLIDKEQKKSDMKLTIGGEPTFVSSKNREAEEWNYTALGEEKYTMSEELLQRLKKDFANAGALIQYCQGKWYPGELLPRWSLNCYWRKDGEPLWKNEHFIARDDASKGYGLKEAEVFIKTFSKVVDVETENVIPCYEDVVYYTWKEASYSEAINQEINRLNAFEQAERKRLLALLDKGLEKETGYVLPLEFDVMGGCWSSNRWTFKRNKLFLHPGDSPMGFRLPLDSIEGEHYSYPTQDPMSFPKKLPSYEEFVSRCKVPELDQNSIGTFDIPSATAEELLQQEKDNLPAKNKKSKMKKLARTAISTEIRNGNLRVFLPPLYSLENFLELIAALEITCDKTGLSIIIEGYDPIRDDRLQRFQITPDPGVIEVNLHPSSSFDEILEKTEKLYKHAEEVHLTAEKFLIDGRHAGTGGGNHITVGSTQPSESPFLRNPSLLRSLIAYWQNHPGLSYLFSGIFIGPTSQAPRIDEARSDSLHELEIAFQQIDKSKEPTPPWLIDRLFRNILVDITGNTHRSEISIDKMFDPNSPTGRLGLVEFRAFEMPPHYKMSVVQQELVMALLTMFWNKPFQRGTVDWNTNLHDRFMLPYFVWSDFKQVMEDLNRAGFPFKEEFFIPFFEFRFPEYGLLEMDGMSLELRMALEPWNVLGEETSSFGTSRSVDTAVERVQVRVKGFTPERHILSCNGYRVPLQPTGTNGDYVAGVRFKAWAPPFTQHPNLPAQQDLVFDIYDLWNGRSMGGCTYHVSHPGGRSYENLPVNSYEAESRRISRFWTHGHNPGYAEQPLPKKQENSKFPCTLDLRFAQE